MTTTKTNELIGQALDWAVAKCRGFEGLDEDQWLLRDGIADMPLSAYTPSTDWSQGGPIIERECIELVPDGAGAWDAAMRGGDMDDIANGPTPLIAAMRCYVLSRVGDEVDVPEELTKE